MLFLEESLQVYTGNWENVHQEIDISTVFYSHLPARRTSCDRPPSAFAWKPAIHQIDPAWQLTGNKKNRQNTPPKTNMSPKKGLFEYEIHLPTIDFQGTCLFSRKYVKYRSHVEELANMNMIPVVKFHLLHCLIFRIRCFNCKNAGLSSAQKWETHTHTLSVFCKKTCLESACLEGPSTSMGCKMYEIGMCYVSSAS